jgi:hypothetical protein
VAALDDGFESREVLRAAWLEHLQDEERCVLEVLVKAYPAAVERDAVAEAAGLPGAVLDRYLNRLRVRHLVTSEGRSAVRAAAELF